MNGENREGFFQSLFISSKMAKPITVLKSIGPKLVPFFKTVALYFVLYPDENPPTIFCCLFKCLPIISLMLFVLLQGMSFSIYYRYSRRILVGLIFSCLGDAFLVWKQNYFMHGIAMFAVSQVMYARAFGWKPFNPYALGVLSVIGIAGYYYVASDLKGVLLCLVALYMVLILTMAWRAIARVQFFDELWTWTKLCGCAGSILFLISDFVIAIDKFRTPVPFSHTIVMSTYYAAQLGISLSVVDSQAEELLIQSKQN